MPSAEPSSLSLELLKTEYSVTLKETGFDLGREHLTGAINAFARAYLHSVTKQIKKDILSKCPVIIMDESTLRVNETARIKQAEGKGIKSQIWTLNSSWTSALQASWYCVSPSRSADVVIDILKNDLKNQDGSVVTKYLLTDALQDMMPASKS